MILLVVFILVLSQLSGAFLMCDKGCENSLSENIYLALFLGLIFPFFGFDLFNNTILVIIYMVLAVIIEILYLYTISCVIYFLINKVRK